MLLEPMYLLMGRNFEQNEASYGFEDCSEHEATAAIFASEPLTGETEDWSELQFGEIVFLERDGDTVTRTVNKLKI